MQYVLDNLLDLNRGVLCYFVILLLALSIDDEAQAYTANEHNDKDDASQFGIFAFKAF
jgi:hypothetical protein